MRRWPMLVLATALAAASALPARTEEADIGALRSRLISASHPHVIDETLDRLAERIGLDPGFADARAFGDWLGRLPDAVAVRTRVKLRRGWAYLAAGRLAEAGPLLEAVAAADDEESAVALGYLGEVARQAGELGRAFARLTEAARRGWRDMFVIECARKTAFQMHEAKESKEFDELPRYATALGGLIEAFDHPLLRATIARWILDDYAAYAVPGAERARLWARTAAAHALTATLASPVSGADARLAFDAAQALEPEDRDTNGRTLRFELLAEAWRLGNRPADDSHEIPQAVALLAEAAVRDGQYELAHRLARQRLGISDSPLARRVLDALPPDVGD